MPIWSRLRSVTLEFYAYFGKYLDKTPWSYIIFCCILKTRLRVISRPYKIFSHLSWLIAIIIKRFKVSVKRSNALTCLSRYRNSVVNFWLFCIFCKYLFTQWNQLLFFFGIFKLMVRRWHCNECYHRKIQFFFRSLDHIDIFSQKDIFESGNTSTMQKKYSLRNTWD